MARWLARAAVFSMVLESMLDMSAAEFAALQRLPAEMRRERLGMPASCSPGLTALKSASGTSGHVTVFVTCKAASSDEAVPGKLVLPR